MPQGRTRLFVVTGSTMIAFAANSVLCRMALGTEAIDPAAFTAIRLMSGAIMLAFVVLARERSFTSYRSVRLAPALVLLAYAIAFSFAYVLIETGTGALLLFAAAQTTMLGLSIARGDRPSLGEWLGIMIAFSGLTYLLLPGLDAPDPGGAALMIGAGVAWGIYSVLGKANTEPTRTTARNFLLAGVLSAGLFLLPLARHVSAEGILLATLSGSITTGLGYVIWYTALPALRITSASTVQLSVPLIAALGGIVFVGEEMTLRLVVSSLLILGGILITIQLARSAS